jgi:hypothetical protein
MSGDKSNGESIHIPQLDLFQRPNVQEAIDSPVIFNIPKQSRDFTDLRNCKLKMQLRLKHLDDTPLTIHEEVGLTNLPHQSSWSEVAVHINGVRVSGNTNLFPYKAVIKAYMRHNNITDAAFMESMGWRALDDMFTTKGNDIGRASRTIELEGPLFEDIFECERYLLNGMDMQIKLQPTPASFRIKESFDTSYTDAELSQLETKMKAAETALQTALDAGGEHQSKRDDLKRAQLSYYSVVGHKKGYKLVLENIVMKMTYVRVNPMVINALQEQLQQQPAVYPYTKTDVKTISIPSGQQQVYFDTIFDGVRPSKVVIAMVSSSTMNGANSRDPTLFQDFYLTDINVAVDGILIQPKKMRYNATEGMAEYISAYEDFIHVVQKSGHQTPNMTPQQFSWNPVFVFALEPIIKKDVHNQVVKGPICVMAQFEKPLTETVNMIIYAEMPALMQVDAARNVALT